MKQYDMIEAEDNYDMALEWIRAREYEKAELCLKTTLRLNPKFVYAYITLSNLFKKKKDYSNAINALKTGYHHDPGFDRLLYLMAKCAYRAGDYQGALRYIERAREQSDCSLYEKSEAIIRRVWSKG